MKHFVAVLVVALVLGCVTPDARNLTLSNTSVKQKITTTSTIAVKKVISREEAARSYSTGCESTSDSRVRNICLRDSAVKLQNPAGCLGVNETALRDECYFKIAVNLKRKSVCESVSDAAVKAVCESKT